MEGSKVPQTNIETKVPFLTENNLAKNKYSKPDKLLSKPDAIVIGSGIGGLGIASILAQRKKWRVLLLEAQKVPGGCTHCHEIDGFEWPTGIDSIGDMDSSVGRGLYRPTIDYITGNQLEWAKMPDVHEVCYFEDDRYDWHSSAEKNIAWVEKQFPMAKVREYYQLEQKIERWAMSWGITKILPSWVPVACHRLFYKLFGGAWRKYMKRKTATVLRDELSFPDKLSSVFSYMYGNHGATPDQSPFSFHAVNLHHYRDGAYYPIGGSGQIAECVIPIVENAGGQLAVDSAVKEILVKKNTATGVELESGEKIYSPLIISDASAHTTFMDLLPRAVSERHGYPEKFTQIRPSVAHLYFFLGFDQWIDLPKEIIWNLPSYDIKTTDARYKAERDFDCMGTYILCPSVRDPSHAQRYPNKSTIIVLAEAPFKWIEQCRSDAAFKAKFEADLTTYMEALLDKRIPQIKGLEPSFRMAGVPMGCNPRAWEDCSLGLEPSVDRFIKHTHWLRPKTKVKRLFLTGQDSFSMGFCGAMFASRLCYSAITGNWLFNLKKKIGSWP